MHSFTIKLHAKSTHDYELQSFEEGKTIPLDARPLSIEAVRDFVERMENQYKTPGLIPNTLGKDLYQWLREMTALDEWRRQYRQIALHIDGGLRQLPWELLHDGEIFLCTRDFIPVRRAADFQPQNHAPKNRPLRVLFMASSPTDAPPELDFEKEEARILYAAKGIELVVEESGSLEGLQRVISDYPESWFDVVHITGHADVDEREPFFWLEDDLGCKQKATVEDFIRAFDGRYPRLLFLSGCKTGQPNAGLPSLSEALARAGVPAVLGWALPVGDVAAIHAAAALYQRLGNGKRLDEAVTRARQALLKRRSLYWHLLRLYANADPLTELVTAPRTNGREKLKAKEAATHFLDAETGRMPVCARQNFVGRRRLLQRALRVLRSEPGDAGYAPGILLHGMGGLGKSSLAARVCDRLSPTHRHWVWVGGINEASVLRMITEKARNPDINAVLEDLRLPLAQRLTKVLEKHLTETLLFVFDDFEHNAESEDWGEKHVIPSTDSIPVRATPRTHADGTLVLRSEAETTLRALLQAIQESQSDSRVIVTCRQKLANLSLHEEGLYSMQGAEWDKKRRALPAFAENSMVPVELREQAETLAAGNPRLLEWLDKVLADQETDSAAVLVAMMGKAAEFREDTLLDALLDQLPDSTVRTLALLALYELPVPEAALSALVLPMFVEGLPRLINLGLVEHWCVNEQDWYFASPLLAPLLTKALSPAERNAALQASTQTLYKLWWQESGGISEIQSLEIRRLAHLAGDQKIAADVTKLLSARAINNNRYREAQHWCEETLKLGEDYRLWHQLARAEKVLGESDVLTHYERALALIPSMTDETNKDTLKEYGALIYDYADLLVQLGQIKEAMKLYQESLSIDETLKDTQGKAATLHNMAGVIAQQGDIPRALQLWNESLELLEKIGDVKGKAATLSMMAGVIAQQGDIPRALQLWNESLELLEKIGDVQGKAATLHNMAGVIAQQGDIPRALQLWNESLELLEKIGDVKGKAATLSNMAGVIAQQGDIPRALQLWNESLELLEKIGDVKGKAATLFMMAGVIAQQGDIPRALQLWNESLELLEKIGDVKGKAATLHNMAGVIAQQGDIPRALQLWNESLELLEKIGDVQGKAATLHNMAGVIAQQGDIPRALQLWNESLELLEKIGDVKGKAATLSMMAGVIAQQGDIPRALQLWNESLELKEKIGDVKGKAATLSNMAGVIAQQGDIPRALQLWNESLELLEKIGDVKGKAATLSNMAGVIAQQGDIPRALQLWNESLELLEKIGDVKGKAATLANMAWVAGRDNDHSHAAVLNRQALQALVQISAWLDVVTVLDNLADSVDDGESLSCVAQALWLSLRIGVPVGQVLKLCAELLHKTGGVAAEHAPLIGAVAIYVVQTRAMGHPKLEELRQYAGGMLVACIIGQGVHEDGIPQWLTEQELLDAAKLLPAVDKLLSHWVTEWAFDKSPFATPGP